MVLQRERERSSSEGRRISSDGRRSGVGRGSGKRSSGLIADGEATVDGDAAVGRATKTFRERRRKGEAGESDACVYSNLQVK